MVLPVPTPQGFACLQATTQGSSPNSLTSSKAPFASLILLLNQVAISTQRPTKDRHRPPDAFWLQRLQPAAQKNASDGTVCLGRTVSINHPSQERRLWKGRSCKRYSAEDRVPIILNSAGSSFRATLINIYSWIQRTGLPQTLIIEFNS